MIDDTNNRVKINVPDLDLEKHGLAFTHRKLRTEKIKRDNNLRKERAWGHVPSLQSYRRKRKPLHSGTSC